MKLVIESTKTNAGTRKLPMTEDVAEINPFVIFAVDIVII